MPPPLTQRQGGILGAIDITLRRGERIELFQIELVFARLIGLWRELRMRPFRDFDVRIVYERLAPDRKRNHHRVIGGFGCELVKKHLIVRRCLVVETVSIAENETIQEDQTLDALGNCLRDFGDYSATETVPHQDKI